MKPNRDLSEHIAKELAAIESEIGQLREKLRALDAQRERLKTTQCVLLRLQGKKQAQACQPSSNSSETRNGSCGARYFHSEGQTVALVRYLYGKSGGSSVVEAAKQTGIATRRTRTAFERLRENGLMTRSGNEYALTQKGMAAWQESPLYGWESNGSHCSSGRRLASDLLRRVGKTVARPLLGLPR